MKYHLLILFFILLITGSPCAQTLNINKSGARLIKESSYAGTFTVNDYQSATPAFNYGKNFHVKGNLSALHPKKRFYLVNVQKPKKRVRVPSYAINILVEEQKKQADEISRFNYIESVFDSLAGDSLKLQLVSEEIEVEHNNYFTAISNTYYVGDYNNMYKNVSVKKIAYVSMRNPFRTVMTGIGRTIMTLSILTIAVSPFTAMHLEGDARAQKRNAVFLSGVSGFVVAIPFYIFGRNKRYGISSNYPTSSRNYWNIQMEYR